MKKLLKGLILMMFIALLGSACNGKSDNKKIKDPENFAVYPNSSFEINADLTTLEQYKIYDGNKIVFVYQRQSTVFVNANDYEPTFTEVLIFEIGSELESFEFKDTELNDINCNYSWKILSNSLQKDIVKLKKGIVKGKKLENGNWKITVNIDTGLKVGGYLERQNSRKIHFEKTV
ncbi:MAG: hypothetical protein H0V01_04740 [Bacteroidetes bacterium]|nr:hypothetical protein [Bacteroidota bacterium]HET6243685.1 hypothetical protein [Bacteroidia bacterium]